MSETKICTKCKQELPIENFRWKNKTEGRRHSQCRDCQKAQEKIHYRESLERRQNVLATAQSQKDRNISIVEQYKQLGCQKCGERRQYVLDCHHLQESSKFDNISKMVKSAGMEQLKKELNKCVVLCSNCHREFHFLEKDQGITIEQYLGQIAQQVER